jgi:hypothetical protein
MRIITYRRKKNSKKGFVATYEVPRRTWAWLAYAVLVASFTITTIVVSALGAYGHPAIAGHSPAIASSTDIPLVTLCTIGTHTEGAETTPLYALRIGDTTTAERSIRFGRATFGLHVLDGAVTARAGFQHARIRWIRTEFDGATTSRSGTDELPAPFNLIPEASVSSVVEYAGGGAKAYLEPDTSPQVARKIGSALCAAEEM